MTFGMGVENWTPQISYSFALMFSPNFFSLLFVIIIIEFSNYLSNELILNNTLLILKHPNGLLSYQIFLPRLLATFKHAHMF
jgi:hypothetical protein